MKGYWETSSDDDDAETDSHESSRDATDSNNIDNLESDLTSATNDVQTQNKTNNIGNSDKIATKSDDIVNNAESTASETVDKLSSHQVRHLIIVNTVSTRHQAYHFAHLHLHQINLFAIFF